MVIKFTPKGFSLVFKEVFNPKVVDDFGKGIKIPPNATTAEQIRVGRNFNPDKYYTDVFVFKGEDGKVISKIHDRHDGFARTTKTRNYTHSEPDYVAYPGERAKQSTYFTDGKKVIEITNGSILNQKNIDSKTVYNGQLIRQDEKVIQSATRKDGKHVVTVASIEKTPMPDGINHEVQKLQQFVNKEKPKGYEISGFHHADGTSEWRGGRYNGIKFNVKDPYMSTHLYNRDDFALASYQKALKDRGIKEIAPEINIDTDLDASFGGHYNDLFESIHLNEKIRKKNQIANYIEHETEHFKQHGEVARGWFTEFGVKVDQRHNPKKYAYVEKFGNFKTAEELAEAKKHEHAIENYVQPDIDYQKYLNNYNEVKAREAGEKAEKIYIENRDNLFSQFPMSKLN